MKKGRAIKWGHERSIAAWQAAVIWMMNRRHNNPTVPASLWCTSSMIMHQTWGSRMLQRYQWVSQVDKLLTCLKVQGGNARAVMKGMFTDSNLKIRSNKTPACIYIKFFTTTRLLNLPSNFVLHSKSFYGCSTFGFKNIRKVICGDLSQTLKTPPDL